MADTVHKKKLTPAQRKERERRRRRRKWKRRLKYIIPTAVAFIAACVFLVIVFTGKGQSVKLGGARTDKTTAMPAAQTQTEQQPTGESMQTATETTTQTVEPTEVATTVPEATAEPTPQPTATPTQEPTATPTPEPTPEPTTFNFDEAYLAALNGEDTGPLIQANYDNVDASKRSRWPAVSEGYMPIFKGGEGVEEKIICVTVDDCYQGDNLKKIVDCAIRTARNLRSFRSAKTSRRNRWAAW